MNSFTEHAHTFTSGGQTLIGIQSLPAATTITDTTATTTGVVIIVGGPQYRAGSHRQFVLLARSLAQAGFPVLRFDYAGMGDSSGDLKDFESAEADVKAAIDEFMRLNPKLERVALWGLCDGASAALLYLHAQNDPRVAGLCLLNPWVRSAESLARTQVKHYYLERLQQREFWLKLLRGKVAKDAIQGLIANLRLASSQKQSRAAPDAHLVYQQKMARAWKNFKGQLLLILAGNDYTAKEFLEYTSASPDWAATLQQTNCSRVDIASADHTFSDTADRLRVENETLNWLTKLAPSTDDGQQ